MPLWETERKRSERWQLSNWTINKQICSVAARQQSRGGLRAACWTNFIHSVFGGGGVLLCGVGQHPLFEEGKKETKNGATKENPGIASCGAGLQPGKQIEVLASLPLRGVQ